ncbi:MAG: aminotransferase class V-fold PLP-dependent enzyme [Vicinamibacterales bacterium]
MNQRLEVEPRGPMLETRDGGRHSALALDADAFRSLGHRLIDRIAERLDAVPRGPVTRHEPPSVVREALELGGPLPEFGVEPGRLLAEVTERLFDHSLLNAHPRFFGYITAAPAPIGMLGDLLASALNANVGARTLSPAATELEAQTVSWIAELIGYPTGCGGLLVSGGNMANLVGLLAARAAAPNWNVREDGVVGPERRRLRLYASTEAHTWIQKAADIGGLGTTSIRWVPVDASLRMNVDALRALVAADANAGDIPCLVAGTAGSVSTGTVDPLREIAAVCRAYDVWFHVDGAYGAFAAALPNASADLRALDVADSVAVDPHKWLYAPLEAGCILVRDKAALRAAFAYHPPYYHFGEHETNYLDYGPQNSRGFRALKVWLALKHAGAAGYRQMIADDIALARAMAAAIAAQPELELVTQELSITTFRYVPSDVRDRTDEEPVERHLDILNRRLLARLQDGGETFVSNAIVGGRYLLRACIVNFHTTRADVVALPEIVVHAGRQVDASLRGPASPRPGGLAVEDPPRSRG